MQCPKCGKRVIKETETDYFCHPAGCGFLQLKTIVPVESARAPVAPSPMARKFYPVNHQIQKGKENRAKVLSYVKYCDNLRELKYSYKQIIELLYEKFGFKISMTAFYDHYNSITDEERRGIVS